MANTTQSGQEFAGSDKLYRVITPDVAMMIGAWLLCMTGFLSLLNPSDLPASAVFRLILVATGFALYGYGRTRKNQQQAARGASAEAGELSGWLILLGAMLCVTVVGAVLQAISDLPLITAGKIWTEYTTPGRAAYHPYWAWLLTFDWGSNLFTLLFVPALLSLFFQKKKAFPAIMFWSLLVFVALAAARFGMASQISHLKADEVMMPLLLSAIKAAIWIPYLRVSKRVKATFVN